ncbi:hypothetical protein IKG13_02375 [Candidatus Saccharibacteria bacterium]|jgi:hypothetical protein|nr:hypothetical protein [Candidatus Saccharibacteria bacterium]MBR3378177.1 hypothetical protein [Candidatus Saccharibacteria bacterium]
MEEGKHEFYDESKWEKETGAEDNGENLNTDEGEDWESLKDYGKDEGDSDQSNDGEDMEF